MGIGGFFAGKYAAQKAMRPGVAKNGSKIIKLPKWYWIIELISTLIVSGLISIPLFYEEAYQNRDSIILLIIILSIWLLLMIPLFFHMLFYKIIIEDEYILFRRLFKFNKYIYKDIQLDPSVSYVFILNNKNKYITRLAKQIDNIQTLWDAYLNYFKVTNTKPVYFKKDYVKQSKIWLILAAICQLSIGVIIMIIFVMAREAFYWSLLLEIPILLLVWYYIIWKIKFDDEHLVYRNFFGVKKKYKLKSLTYIYSNCGYWILYNNKKKIFLWTLLDSYDLLGKIKERKIKKKTYK